MNLPDKKISAFIGRHHVLTLATTGDDGPWCANIFYAYVPSRNLFVYTSDPATRHGTESSAAPLVAASIVLETRTVGRVKGLQVQGRVRMCGEDEKWARRAYLKSFPYAAAAHLDLWTLEPHVMKYTDNRLGFGKKLIWTYDGKE